MSRIVNVQDTEYKLSVSPNGKITLDTGDQIGEVVITGNLTVWGTQTTVNTTELDIEDNIITLNRGETENGISINPDGSRSSGITIDRGTAPWAQFHFDETITWLDLQPGFPGTSRSGGFVLRHANGLLSGLQTISITTDGNDLSLLGTGNNVVTVTGTNSYEQQIFPYSGNNLTSITPIDDDNIPNIRAVIDYTNKYFELTPPFKIQDSRLVGGVTELSDSVLTISDAGFDGGISNLRLELDGALNAIWEPTFHEVQDIRISGTTIESTVLNQDLSISSFGDGSVKINDNLKLATIATPPTVAVDGTKVYSNDEAQGGSGIFFVNTKDTRDELVSKRKALAYSMIF